MKQNHYNDELEKMLRESTEDFRMYPSRKVWHSIYNDLHPDRRWPSLAVCLVLLTAILHIGVSNNNSISKNVPNLLTSSIDAERSTKSILTIKNSTTRAVDNTTAKNNSLVSLDPETGVSQLNNTDYVDYIGQRSPAEKIQGNQDQPKLSISAPMTPALNNEVNNFVVSNNKDAVLTGSNPSANVENKPVLNFDAPRYVTAPPVAKTTKVNGLYSNDYKTTSTPPVESASITAKTKGVTVAGVDLKVADKTAPNFVLSTQEREWIDNYAFYNKKNKEKWKSTLSMQYYITPSFGYRELYKNNEYVPAVPGFLLRTSNRFGDDEITQQAAMGVEGGAALLIKTSKKLRIKAGVQFNLTNYVTYAHKLEHPTQTTVLLNGANNIIIPTSYSTAYGNVPGSNFNRINNKTAQFSLPVGLDYKIVGRDKVKWYIGASIQPTRLIGGDVYLISSDLKNFAEDQSMLRKWNVNASAETFISYKMPSGLNINIGPQVRYQLMSTYNSRYTYTEKLFNVGLKVGLSTNF